MALTRTKIEYLNFCWNWFPGCRHYEQGFCPLKRCWARGMSRFTDPTFTPTFKPELLRDPVEENHRPSRIGVNFTGDLFGDWVDPDTDLHPYFPCAGEDEPLTLKQYVFDVIKYCPQHKFIFLTKRPDRLHLWSPFPANCWVGVSATNYRTATDACGWLDNVEARVKFLSLEPLLAWGSDKLNTSAAVNWFSDLNWIIIGQKTPVSERTRPKPDWIREIITATNRVDIPIFVKDNIINDPMMDLRLTEMRQEYPKEN